ncbi:MAG TPA: prepilin-type N-terminal cleavage/methylation domain-containing protein [Chlamydiales bacterium]|nr:prepilin-type N-terminal cleavage/methylation domain-containing protein [Chlamydiales bacterium]
MKRKKRALTLLEIMIVIFLITLITGAIGYNMKGTLDRGRAFRTEQAKAQLHDLLLICLEEGATPDELEKDPVPSLKKYNLAKNSEKLVQDGWGSQFVIHYNRNERDFKITSSAYDKYKQKIDKQAPSDEDE